MKSVSLTLILNLYSIQEKKSGPNFKITKGVSKESDQDQSLVFEFNSVQLLLYIYTRTTVWQK